MKIIVYANILLIVFVSFSISQDDKVLSKIHFKNKGCTTIISLYKY